MPIYEYVCEECGKELEVMQRMSEAKLVDCPACGKPNLRKKISAPGFRLKGGGWYETDFKAGSKKNIAGEGGPSGSSGGGEAKASSGGDAKASESKPASTPSAPSTSGSDK